MKTSEIIEIFSKQASRAEKGLAAAKLSNNYQLLALNARQSFKSQLMLGLIKWRQHEDCLFHFERCVDDIRANANALRAIDAAEKIHHQLPIERASILSFLIGKIVDINMDLEEFELPERQLDLFLALALSTDVNTGKTEIKTSKAIKELASKANGNLVSSTYQTYFEILEKSNNGLSIDDSVRFAEDLFKRRVNDGFYSGGEQTEGGGQDNLVVVDYRLAAVLKKVNYKGDSIHSWR